MKAGVCNFGTECGVADNDVTPPGAELSICDQTVPASEREEQELNGRTITVVKDGASEVRTLMYLLKTIHLNRYHHRSKIGYVENRCQRFG